MARPPVLPGTLGRIRIYRTTNGYRARTMVRDYDGRTRQLERNGPTKTSAGTAVKSAVRDRGPRFGGSLLRMTSACSQG
jgi:hypothetical protein